MMAAPEEAMQKPTVLCAMLATMVVKHRWGAPIGEEALLALSAIDGDYPAGRRAYAKLQHEPYISIRGNRGIELDSGNFGALADVLYHECGWEPWEIRTRLKHYVGIDEHEWA